MPITARERHRILLADRSQNIAPVTVVIATVLHQNPSATRAEVEEVLREAAAQSYLIADGSGFRVVLGMKTWVAELGRLNRTPEANRQMLAAVVNPDQS